MKKRFFFLLGMVAALTACTPDANSIIGAWTVDKVNVGFDASRSTPELVKQIGKMEQKNTILISPDSTLIFNSLENKQQGRLHLIDGSNLFLNNTFFGTWKNGVIVTKTDSPIGEIIVTYKKDN